MTVAPRYFVAVTTCERPDMLWALVQQLASQSYTHPSLEVAVFDDATRAPLIERPDASDLFRRHGWSYRRFTERRGRERFWQTWGDLFAAFRASKATHLVTLPDDCIVAGEFLTTLDGLMGPAWSRGRRIEALNLHVDDRNTTPPRGGCNERMGWGVELHSRLVLDVFRIDWLDGFNALSRTVFDETVPFNLPPERDWSMPGLGSGVGGALSACLRAAGIPIYGLSCSLVKHIGKDSVMRPGRVPRPTRRFVDDVVPG